MTPQERQLLDELFERLAKLESAPRDADAIRAINDGLERAPHATYALVQSVLVQDEALKRADARIQELEAKLGDGQPDAAAPQGGFLDSMRDAVLGRSHQEQGGSVPTVRPGASPWGSGGAPSQQPAGSPWSNSAGGGNPGSSWNAPAGQPAAGAPGGSFLGTAASAAAGMVAGGLLLNGIRSMFGSHQSQAFGSYRDGPGSQGFGSGGGGDLARQAGIDDIGGARTAAYDDRGGAQSAGLFDQAQQDAADDRDADDDDEADFEDDSDSDDDSDDVA